MSAVIAGIQQIGIGVKDVKEASKWYLDHFGMDIKVLEDAATADKMTIYTGGEAHQRIARIMLNMKGGGGFEIWQYRSRTPVGPDFEIQLGDFGINAAKVKSVDVKATYQFLKDKGANLLTEVVQNPAGEEHFFVADPYGNVFNVVKGLGFYSLNTKFTTGGIAGAVIGVSDIDKSRSLYSDILGYAEVVYDEEGSFDDFNGLTGADGHTFRRCLLRHSKERKGGFAELLGPTEIELITVKDRDARKVFEDRYWGDLGFIHICWDVQGMDDLGETLTTAGFPFTVDSEENKDKSFDMGEAAGRFTYIDDPDGTWVEFVETHKVPLLKALGIYLNMKKRDPRKNLPRYLLNAMALSRVKE